MRFIILTQYYPPEIGAPQVRLSAFTHELKRHGHDVQVVTALPNYPKGVIEPEYQGKLWVRERLNDIPVTRTWIYPATGRNIVKRLLNYFSFTFSSLWALATLPHADVIFVESPPLFLCLSAWLISVLRRQKLCVAGQHSEAIVRHMDKFNIGIRFGDFYTRRLIEALNLQVQGGVVRVSVAHYNTAEEIDKLISHLEEVIGRSD